MCCLVLNLFDCSLCGCFVFAEHFGGFEYVSFVFVGMFLICICWGWVGFCVFGLLVWVLVD